mgnify:CR=1
MWQGIQQHNSADTLSRPHCALLAAHRAPGSHMPYLCRQVCGTQQQRGPLANTNTIVPVMPIQLGQPEPTA